MKHELTTVKDFSKFAFLAENREIIKNKKAKEKLKNSINERGILQPITVMPFDIDNPDHLLNDGLPHLLSKPTDSGEMKDVSKVEYLVLDGAHRFTFAEDLGKEIPVVINPLFNRMDIISLNNMATKWSTEDYVDCFARLRVPGYAELKKEIDKWRDKRFSVTDVAIHYSSDRNNSASELIKTMSYKFDKVKGDKILQSSLAFKSVPSIAEISLYNKRSVTVTISQLLSKYKESFSAIDMASHINEKGIPFTEEDNNKKAMYDKLLRILFEICDEGRSSKRNFSERQKKAIAERDGVICRASKCSEDVYDNLEVDHKNPDNGNNTTISNGQLLCRSCNAIKSGMPFTQWLNMQHE